VRSTLTVVWVWGDPDNIEIMGIALLRREVYETEKEHVIEVDASTIDGAIGNAREL